MSRTGSCPVCSREMALPEDADGRKVHCRDCGNTLRIHGEVGLRYELELVDQQGAVVPSVCGVCGAETRATDTFCGSCGVDLAAVAVATVGAGGPAARQRRPAPRRGRHAQAMRKKSARSAAKWLLGLGILFVLGGLFMSYTMQREVQKARDNLEQFTDDEPLQLEDGTMTTAAELRRQIDFEEVFVPVLNFGLAALMFGLFVWARRSPFPAILTGLCTYVAVIVVNACLDPVTLAQGIIIKVIAIAGLLDGLKAAIAERAVEHREPGVR